MPVPGPSVLPQYYGGNPGQLIAQAYLQQQAFNRQRDLDAVETGVGLQRGDVVSTDAPLSFGDRIRQTVQRVTGQGQQATPAQIAATRQGLNTLASRQAAANNASLGADTTSPVAAGSYTPQGIPQTLRLPSGQVVPTMFVPAGQRIYEAALQRQFNMAVLGQRLDAQREIAGMRTDASRYGADLRYQASTENHNTMTPFQQWRTEHPLPIAPRATTPTRPPANQPGSVGALTHVVAADRAAVSDLNAQLNAARKNPPTGRQILRQNPEADTCEEQELIRLWLAYLPVPNS